MTSKHLGIAYLIFAAIIGSVLIYQEWDARRDKFIVGDCIETVYETEFYRTVYYQRIDKVGKKAYMTSIKKAGDNYFYHTKDFEWKFELNKKDKVDPKFCEVENG